MVVSKMEITTYYSLSVFSSDSSSFSSISSICGNADATSAKSFSVSYCAIPIGWVMPRSENSAFLLLLVRQRSKPIVGLSSGATPSFLAENCFIKFSRWYELFSRYFSHKSKRSSQGRGFMSLILDRTSRRVRPLAFRFFMIRVRENSAHARIVSKRKGIVIIKPRMMNQTSSRVLVLKLMIVTSKELPYF